MNYPTDNLICYDLEVFPGWFLAGFELPDGGIYQFEVSDARPYQGDIEQFLTWAKLAGYTLAGFNSQGYDDRVLSEFLRNPHPASALRVSVAIIVQGEPPWRFDNTIDSIDLMPLLPGRIGLKKVGVCLGHVRLQELPIPWDQVPSPEEQEVLRSYNRNDLAITRKLLREVQPELDLRGAMSRQYGVDLRSKGDATMAEAILLAEYARLGGTERKKDLNQRGRDLVSMDPRVRIKTPSWWNSFSPERYPSLARVREIGERIFATPIPIVNDRVPGGFLNRILFLGDRYYQMGVGGLHSIDGPGCWVPRPDEILVDVDVASYYPNIALTQDLAPRPWGAAFSPIYREIVRRRLDAKHAGNKTEADCLKIVVNGTFGKTSDPFSALCDPEMMANITVLGQLGLLALIALLDGVANVVSANTDGLTLLATRADYPRVRAIVSEWEQRTGLEMEYTEYRGLWQRDCNNYLAAGVDGKLKTKGRLVARWPDLRHTPNGNIVALAIQALVRDGTPLDQTIYQCLDINQFILTQAVTGDWTTSWNGRRLGKMLRFYKSNRADAAPIIRRPGGEAKGNECNVPNSEGCIPLEDLPEQFPDDLNYAWYLAEARALWETLSVPKTPGMNRMAEAAAQVGLRPCYLDPEDPPSRARVIYGEQDFTSRRPGQVLGTGTGDGLLARLGDRGVEIYRVNRPYPSRTRAKVKTEQGWELVYGARVPLSLPCFEVFPLSLGDEAFLDEFYTAAELRKVYP